MNTYTNWGSKERIMTKQLSDRKKNTGKLLLSNRFLIEELDLPYNAIEDNVIGNDRWSVHHCIIFEYEGKYYRAYYSVGATEMQDESPWEYEDVVSCEEVELREVLVKQWCPVEVEEK